MFLDRDGVLNEVVLRQNLVGSPRQINEFRLLPRVDEATALLKKAGFFLVVVTNQPDVARGLLKKTDLEEMHELLGAHCPLDAILSCQSADDSDPRRKPNPGMILEARDQFKIDLKKSFMVGDSDKDLGAGKAAGVRTILIETSYNEAIHGQGKWNVLDLLAAAKLIVSRKNDLQ